MPVAGRAVAFAIDQYDLSRYFDEFKFKRDAQLVDTTGFGQRVGDFLAGIQKATLEMKGFYEGGIDKVDYVIHERFGQDEDVNLLLAPNTYKAMRPCYLLPTVIVKYDPSTKIKDAVLIDVEFATRGFVDNGFILASSLDPVSASGVSNDLDNGEVLGSTNAGASAQLHVFKTAGTTQTLDAVIEHSDDGSVWSTLMTFAQVTDQPSVERIVIEPGIEIKQHVRASWDVSGTDAKFNQLLAFARGVEYDD